MMARICYFIQKSIQSICNKFNFQVDRIDINSYSFKEDHRYQKESQDRYYRIKSGKTFDSFKQLIKKFIPNKLIKLRQMIKDANNVDEMNKLGLFTINSGDNCYLRGILKKK